MKPSPAEPGTGHLDRTVLVLLAVGAVLNACVWIYVTVRFSSLPDVLPIHYNSAGDVDRIGFKQQLFILPVIGLVAVAGNAGLSVFLQARERQLARLLQSLTIVVQLLVVGAAVRLVH